jgi:diadenosine tetraphosphatase ApaH/serine/threonine PP2A family protein phosphatase
MRYAIFTDIHANLEALETVLAKIDEIAQEEPIDEIWFLGDLVGYGPNPNECIDKLRERTNVIIAGNHDWAAVGKLDLEDFSEAARISAEWTAAELTEEHRAFLANLPEHIEKDDVLLVHGSPYGPLWEYLTSEVLAERSFQEFSNRFCFVGHTHVPIIFQQPDSIANTPTRPLELPTEEGQPLDQDDDSYATETDLQQKNGDKLAEEAHSQTEQMQNLVANAADAVAGLQHQIADDAPEVQIASTPSELKEIITAKEAEARGISGESKLTEESGEDLAYDDVEEEEEEGEDLEQDDDIEGETTPEETIQNAEERLNQEIEELLTLLGLSQSMIEVTNEMIVPPEGKWQAPEGYRAIVNPGGVGQPRDGDPRAAFMIYDTEQGFTFYRIPYSFEKTQEKIIKAKLPQYLATRLAYGR